MASYNLGQAAIINRGAYSSSATYNQLNTVSHRGGTFMCIVSCSNIEPGVNATWRNYWVQTAIGVYSGAVTATGSNVTVTFTMSDGTTIPLTYPATAIAANTITNAMLAELIAIDHGGTGANTASGALTNLGIPTPFSVANGGTGADNADDARGNINAQVQAVTYAVSLAGGASSWTKTTDINSQPLTDILSGSNLVVAPAPASWADYRNYGVRMTAQADHSVTFTAETAVPSGKNLTVNILVFN